MSINTRVSEWFKLALEEGRTQTYFSGLWGISKQSISGYVRGSESIGLNPVLKILDFDKRINARWLLFGEGEMYSVESEKLSATGSSANHSSRSGHADSNVKKLYDELIRQLNVKDDQILFLQQLIDEKLK